MIYSHICIYVHNLYIYISYVICQMSYIKIICMCIYIHIGLYTPRSTVNNLDISAAALALSTAQSLVELNSPVIRAFSDLKGHLVGGWSPTYVKKIFH